MKNNNDNKNLHRAKAAKNDEFYTLLSDIEDELRHYPEGTFKDKIVYCNCDDGFQSKFWEFFHLNFSRLGLKRLIATGYKKGEQAYKYEYDGGDGLGWSSDIRLEECEITKLEGDGDFRNAECIEILKKADIVVTNPPFSLFREYLAQLMEYEKKFIIWGNYNSVGCKNIFPYIKENKIWLGYITHKSLYYRIQDSSTKWDEKYTAKMNDGHKYIIGPACAIFTNIPIEKHREHLIKEQLWREYYKDPNFFPKYDNYDAINVDRVVDIPIDYFGVMGVPITFLDRYNPEEFEIVGANNHDDTPCRVERNYTKLGFKFLTIYGEESKAGGLRDRFTCKIPYVNAKEYAISPDGKIKLQACYSRIFIKRVKKESE